MPRSISPSENHLKARLLNELRRSKRISASTVLANELPLGTTGVRADLAFYAKYFTGVEIKSDRDSLKRLGHQLPVYRHHFDRTILVLGSKHQSEISDLDLDGVEVWIANGLSLRKIQDGEVSDRGGYHLALLPAALQRGLQCEDSGLAEARTAFRQAFYDRFRSTSESFWLTTKDAPITSEHLPLLSRFVEKRQLISVAIAEAQKAREEWKRTLFQSVHSSSVSKKDASSS